MSQGSMWNRAKKVTVLVEDESGFEYQLTFGNDEASKLHVESAMNQQYAGSSSLFGVPLYQHPVSREFTMKINF